MGSAKTWRGIFVALLATTTDALLLDVPPETGFLIAVYAILGDLLSSFIKRRLAMAPSREAPLIDQEPGSLFPAFMMVKNFYLEITSILMLVFVFTIIDLVVTYSL